MVPIVSFVGYSNSGKTTFLTKVIPLLKEQGWRVGIIKHDGHDFDIDHVGTDTWQHRQAGADAVAIASSRQVAVMKDTAAAASIDEIVPLLGAVDIVLTEGFKQESKWQIEVNRLGAPCIGQKTNTIAVVADRELYPGVLHFALEDAAGVAQLLLQLVTKGKENAK